MSSNLKLSNSLAKINYAKNLVIKGTCELKSLPDYEEHKLNPQLVNDLMNFLEKEIRSGKFSKAKFDKSAILKEIITSVFGSLTDTEIQLLETQVLYVIDNKLVKKKTFLGQFLKLAISFLCTKTQKT